MSGLTFPIVLPASTLLGRFANSTGDAEAIPFAKIATILGVGGTYLSAGSVAGTNTITGTTATAPVLAAGQVVFFTPQNTNTGPATFNRDGTGAKAILYDGLALIAGELIQNAPAILVYDGTQYNLLFNPIANTSGLSSVAGTNTITAISPVAFTAYKINQTFTLIPLNTNTGATTLNVSAPGAIGAKNIFQNGAACVGGEIVAGIPLRVTYDGTQFNILGFPNINPLTADATPDPDADYVETFDASATANKKVLIKNLKRLNPLTTSLAGDVTLNNTTTYFDGPTLTQGTAAATWYASATLTMTDTSGAANYSAKLWDGTTIIASARGTSSAANAPTTITLSGFITSPTGNIRMSVKDETSTSGKIQANASGNAKDSTITAMRIA